MTKRNVAIVCGGRDYNDRDVVYKALDLIHGDKPFTKVVQGWARGADKLAHDWAAKRRVPSTGNKYRITPAMWLKQGKAAGYNRNKEMRDKEHPDVVIAFDGGPGTQMMVDLAHEADIRVMRVTVTGSIYIETKE